jgi:hypothetical protein
MAARSSAEVTARAYRGRSMLPGPSADRLSRIGGRLLLIGGGRLSHGGWLRRRGCLRHQRSLRHDLILRMRLFAAHGGSEVAQPAAK